MYAICTRCEPCFGRGYRTPLTPRDNTCRACRGLGEKRKTFPDRESAERYYQQQTARGLSPRRDYATIEEAP